MDDESKLRPGAAPASFGQAIEQELLSDYQVTVVGVSDQSFRQMAERAAFVTTDGETVTDARTLARQIGLLRAIRNHDLRRVVSFHSRIDSASRFATSLRDLAKWIPGDLRPLGVLWAEHVSGKMTSGERETRLNRLRAVGIGERGILTNARCLAEGVDVPALDGVAFIDPRRSQIDIVQAVGRAIRTAEDKTVGTIVIPVFVDEEADPEQALESGEFDRVWQVSQGAPRPRRSPRRRAGRATPRTRSARISRREAGKIVLDVPKGVSIEFARAFDVGSSRERPNLGVLVRTSRTLRLPRQPRARPQNAPGERLLAPELDKQPTHRVR